MANILKNKKFYFIILIIVFALLGLSFFGYCIYNKVSLKNEVLRVEDYYLKNYSRKKFVKKALRDIDIYNKNILQKYVYDKFDLFLKINSNPSYSITQYANLYKESFDVLTGLKSSKAIYSKDYREIKKSLHNFKFEEILNKLHFITFKNNSSDILAKKKYFEGIINELNFAFNSAKIAYLESTKLNPYEPRYYNRLGNVYYVLYDFESAIDVFSNALNVANFTSKKNRYSELELLFNLARTYNIVRNNEKAFSAFSNLLVNAINMNNADYEWLAVYNMALIEASVGNYDVSIDYLKYALKLATKMRNKEYMANSLNTLSGIEYRYGDYDNGKRNALKAVKFAKKIHNLGLMANASLNVCLNYDYLYKEDLATIYCNRALKINNLAGKIIGRPEYYLQNGFIYSFVSTFRDYGISLENYTKAYEISKNLNLMLLESNALSGMAEDNNMLGNSDLALDYLQNSIKIEKDLNINDRIGSNINFGQIYWTKGDLDKAIPYYKKAIFLGLKNGNNLVVSTAASHLAIIYNDEGKYSDGLKYSTLSLEANRKVYRFDHHYIKYQEGWQEALLDKLNNKKGK